MMVIKNNETTVRIEYSIRESISKSIRAALQEVRKRQSNKLDYTIFNKKRRKR